MNFEGHFCCVAHRRVLCCPESVGLPETRVLYAIVFMSKEKGQREWKACPIEYLHATDEHDAKWWFFQTESPELMRRIHMVAVAPVVGYFVNDEHGESLSV